MKLLVSKKKREPEHPPTNGVPHPKATGEPKRYPQWHGRTLEEQQALVSSLMGRYRHLLRPGEEFMREKQEEIDREERRYRS